MGRNHLKEAVLIPEGRIFFVWHMAKYWMPVQQLKTLLTRDLQSHLAEDEASTFQVASFDLVFHHFLSFPSKLLVIKGNVMENVRLIDTQQRMVLIKFGPS